MNYIDRKNESLSKYIERTQTTGMYINVRTFDKEQLTLYLSDIEQVHSVFENYTALIDSQVKYKDTHCRKYTKVRDSGHTYTNIYCYNLKIMLPTKLPEKLTYEKLIQMFLYKFDVRIKEKELLWAYRLTQEDHSCYGDVILFTRPFLKMERKYERYEHNYWWNPESKKMAAANSEGAVLLHKKGDYKLDGSGEQIERVVSDVSDMECRIFKFQGKEGFLALVEQMKRILRAVFQKETDYLNKNYQHYFKFISLKKAHAKTTMYKILIRNEFIREINTEIAPLIDAFRYGGFDEDEYLNTIFRRFIRKMKSNLYKNKHKTNTGLILPLELNTPWKTYKENIITYEEDIMKDLRTIQKDIEIYVNTWYQLEVKPV